MITPSPTNTAALLGLDLNGIMWTDHTLQPGLSGCAKVSPACANCYAEVTAAGIVRKGRSDKAPAGLRDVAEFYAKGLTDDGRWNGRVYVDASRIEPAFAKLPKRPGSRIRRVFVTSMSDLFHDDVPDEFICKVLAEMRARPWLVFQVLTKRAERLARFAAGYGWGWPPNVWIGCTVEDQRRADERIPHLLRVPAAVRFLSVEPMLGAIDLSARAEGIVKVAGDDEDGWYCISNEHHDPLMRTWDTAADARSELDAELGPNLNWWEEEPGVWMANVPRIDWVIIGSESDGPRPGKRKTDPAHVLDLVDQCDAAGTAVFVKQIEIDGRLCALPMINGRVRAEFPEASR